MQMPAGVDFTSLIAELRNLEDLADTGGHFNKDIEKVMSVTGISSKVHKPKTTSK